MPALFALAVILSVQQSTPPPPPPPHHARLRARRRLDARRLEAGERIPERIGTAQSVRARRHAGADDRGPAISPDPNNIARESGAARGHQARAGTPRRSATPDGGATRPR